MTQVGRLIIEDSITIDMEKETEKIIKTMLLKNKTIEEIHKDTNIPLEIIQSVKNLL